jgi:hypothetical protein
MELRVPRKRAPAEPARCEQALGQLEALALPPPALAKRLAEPVKAQVAQERTEKNA